MKFTDGFWHKREGVVALHPQHTQDVRTTRDTLTVYAATKRVHHRGDTLNAPMITVVASSPMPDVIRIKISHFLGERERLPRFAVATDPSLRALVDETSLTAGALTARFETGDK